MQRLWASLLGAAVLMFLLCGAGVLQAQTPGSPAEARAGAVYGASLGTTDGVTAARGPGFYLQGSYRLHPHFSLGLRAGYARLGVEQQAAVERWGWAYWERSYEHEVNTILQDTAFSARLDPFQHATLLSAALLPTFHVGAGPLSLTLAAGPSVTFYSRRLYLREQWRRHYPEVDHAFEYSFRNYAEDKIGFAAGVDAGLQGAWRLNALVDLVGGLHYRYLLRRADAHLPLQDLLSAHVGLAFSY